MSTFHSESKNDNLQLTVRVKFLNLNQAQVPSDGSSRNQTAEENRLDALLAQPGKRHRPSTTSEQVAKTKPERRHAGSSVPRKSRPEPCLQKYGKTTAGSFEEHIETCQVCANRVALQLDFMACLETAVYQRLSEPKSERIHGALMISAPKLNFAICGELEVG
jgi:hypothetical protein